MNISKTRKTAALRLLYTPLVVILIATSLTACSSQVDPPAAVPSPNLETLPAPTSTPPPSEETPLPLAEGRYIRDEYCARIFDYHQTFHGPLTIAIADNLTEPLNSEELTNKVLEHYLMLAANSPAPFSLPLTVFVLPDPNNGGCSSRDHLVFAAPEDLDSKSFLEDLLGAGTGINQSWIQAGLTSIALGDQPDLAVLKSWYQSTDDLDMAGLFYARFHEDWATAEEIQIARMSAYSLLQYALEIENIQLGNIVEQVNNDLRTRWLASLGVDRTVTYPYDGRFLGFTFSQSSDCPLIVQADTMHFCLTRMADQESFDEISEAEFLIDHAYYGRKALAEYLMVEAPSVNHLINPEGATIPQVPIGHTHTKQNSNVYDYTIHEILHTFNWNLFSQPDSQVWLTEGFSAYLLGLLPIYQQAEQSCIYKEIIDQSWEVESSITPGTSSCYFLDAEQLKAARDWYLVQEGNFETEESIDPARYTDAAAFATIHRGSYGGPRGVLLGEAYESLDRFMSLEGQDGLELSTTQAASFVAWLFNTYSVDRVLDVYINHAEDDLLDGKTYQELKSEWLEYLISGGEGIKIPEGD